MSSSQLHMLPYVHTYNSTVEVSQRECCLKGFSDKFIKNSIYGEKNVLMWKISHILKTQKTHT
jgi:hypothetical protein